MKIIEFIYINFYIYIKTLKFWRLPTPVSALIHAATMVTAGVFLVIRSSFIFENSYNVLIFISFIGGFTCLFSGLIGVFQFDIKKIVAYSTCSQLGYMFFSCGMSNYNVGLFHLFNHAFFKALLFLSMGSIIHALCDEQDIRKMGGILRFLPITYVMVFIGSLSLMALPFLTGYYSKDFLLEFIFSVYTVDSFFIYFLGVFSAFLTAFYSFRLIYWVFFSYSNKYKFYYLFLNEWNFYMILPMSILSICSIFVGYLFYDSFLGIGSLFWGNSIYVNFLNYSIIDAEFSLFLMKFIPLFITLLGILSFFIINKFLWDFFFYYFFKNNYIWFIYYFFNKALFFDYIINNVFLNYLLKLSYFYVYKYIEKGVFEFFGPILIYIFFNKIYNELKFLNSGLVYNYIFLILWSMIIFIILFEFIFLFNIGLILIFIFGFFFIFKIKNMDYLGNQR